MVTEENCLLNCAAMHSSTYVLVDSTDLVCGVEDHAQELVTYVAILHRDP
jgi:hypothetical protein